MIFKENSTTKVCNFYVNNWHLLTTLFPYLNKNMSKNTQIITMLENNLETYAKTLVEKIILNNRDKEKILNVNWCQTEIEDENFTMNFKKYLQKNKELILIVNGSNEYIKYTNSIITNLIKKKEISIKNIKIINCFDISNEDINMTEILSDHKSVLNTVGEITVEEFGKKII